MPLLEEAILDEIFASDILARITTALAILIRTVDWGSFLRVFIRLARSRFVSFSFDIWLGRYGIVPHLRYPFSFVFITCVFYPIIVARDSREITT